MDVLVERFDPKKVGFEIDVFWVSIAGVDPAKTIRDLGARVRLLHLKDKAKGTANSFQESQVKPEAFAEVGSGVVDFPGRARRGQGGGSGPRLRGAGPDAGRSRREPQEELRLPGHVKS